MQAVAKRTPRACERCRRTRRRCEPPYPCRQCIAAGTPCDVRDKARPLRRQLRGPSAPTSRLHCSIAQTRDSRDDAQVGRSTEPRPGSGSLHEPASRNVDERTQGDTFELLKSFVQDVLFEQHGYMLDCNLIEPPSCKPGGVGNYISLLEQCDVSPVPAMTSASVWLLLEAFQKFVGWQDAMLIDIEALHATACAHMVHLLDLSPSAVSSRVTKHRLPLDTIALVFGSLALGAVAVGEFRKGRFFFGISTEMVKHFVGKPTLDLCLAYFLQHLFALRAGTSNYAQGIMAQAIQIAHELGLHHNTHGLQGLQLYLLIYMADQYCSLTHNTEPIIRTSKLRSRIFSPLSDAEPQLKTLVDLVMMNGYVIEHSHGLRAQTPDSILELEAKIGNLCSQQARPASLRSRCVGLRATYEPLARVHMLCCRLRLRAPGLCDQGSWLASLCICLHAAESVLATYFPLYRPALLALAEQTRPGNGLGIGTSTPVACTLAITWRQVKRVMMSAFVIIFAYWHGELIHEEACRYMAMARLLLEYPRWRWGEKLDEAVRTLTDIARLGDIQLHEHMKRLLPQVDNQFPRPLREHPPAAADLSAHSAQTFAPDTGSQAEQFTVPGPWPGIFDPISIDGLSGYNISTIEDQTLFGLWETPEFPMNGSLWSNEFGFLSAPRS